MTRHPQTLAHNLSDLANSFEPFARKCWIFDQGHHLGDDPYVSYICEELEIVDDTDGGKLVITLPPRHGKTLLTSYFVAWYLGRLPHRKVIVVTYNQDLAEKITYTIRKIILSPFFKKIFSTRLAGDRKRVGDFATIQGGGVFATSINGAIAGHGADLIVVDDALNLRDASNAQHIENVNEIFDTQILSRLNKPSDGRVIVIGHRLHPMDLPAHVMKSKGCRRVELSLVATREKTYKLSTGDWMRKKGSLLRAGSHSKTQIEKLKSQTMPPYDLFYQQGLAGSLRGLQSKHIQAYGIAELSAGPYVMSVDTAQKVGALNSYTVMQVWAPRQNGYFLIHQFREQCGYQNLKSAFWSIYRKFRPSAVLVEDRGSGTALIEDIRSKLKTMLVAIDPGRRSKLDRLQAHASLIRRGMIYLPETAAWRESFITEVIECPGQFTDQVDAMTQFLDFMLTKPTLRNMAAAGSGVCISSQGFAPPLAPRATDFGRVGVVVLGSKMRW